MPATSLLAKLRRDNPTIHFARSDEFRWSPQEDTVFYADSRNIAQLLHETSHALLGHRDFTRDITLLEMERDAWENAKQLAAAYALPLSDTTANNALDTYRSWLHARSTCPTCSMTGFQHARYEYRCPACVTSWRVNDARICGLKRYVITK